MSEMTTEPGKGSLGRYYAVNGCVHKEPVEHKRDRGTSYDIGFPVCKMLEYVGEDAAETVAELMRRGDEYDALNKRIAALEAALREIYERMGGDEMDGWHGPEDVHGIARAALENKED